MTNEKNAKTVKIQPEVIQASWTGRAAGIAGAVVATGIDVYQRGVTPGNMVSGAVGAATGYLLGSMIDSVQTASKYMGGGTMPIAVGLVAAVGFATTAGWQDLTDRYQERYEPESEQPGNDQSFNKMIMNRITGI